MKTTIKQDEYGEYYDRYVQHSNGLDLLKLLSENHVEMTRIFNNLDDKKALYKYDVGKWSIKQVLGHVIDTERIFNYRAFALARGEKSALSGYDHDEYMKNVSFDRFSLKELQSQYCVTRDYTISIFKSFGKEELLSKGVVNGSPFTVRALGYVIAGHEIHHRAILKERYHLKGNLN